MCGGALYQREDDKPDIIRERLRIYEAQTQPLISYYQGKVPFANIECNSVDIPPVIIVKEILQELRKLGLIKRFE